MAQRKRPRTYCRSKINDKSDLFDNLPDDIVVCILCKLSSSASSPSDFISILLTCKRLGRLATQPLVLSKAGPETFAIKASNWSESAHRFFKQCVAAGNPEACYTLGMIRFYCLQNRGSGASLMAKAAIKSHAPALYSLAVIQFNGSGGSKNDKDLRAGVTLCARAAVLGHVDALRELGHCLQDGYGVPQNIAEGRRLLVQANARELASSLRSISILTWQHHPPQLQQQQQPRHVTVGPVPGWSLLSDYGCHVAEREVHPANRFLREWFETAGREGGSEETGLRMCSHGGCGRPETRQHEFRRCSVCGKVNYCSRGCQASDWKVRHRLECVAMEGVGGDNGIAGIVVEMEGEV